MLAAFSAPKAASCLAACTTAECLNCSCGAHHAADWSEAGQRRTKVTGKESCRETTFLTSMRESRESLGLLWTCLRARVSSKVCLCKDEEACLSLGSGGVPLGLQLGNPGSHLPAHVCQLSLQCLPGLLCLREPP